MPRFLILTAASGTGPPCSSVTTPVSVAPETCATTEWVQGPKRAKAIARTKSGTATALLVFDPNTFIPTSEAFPIYFGPCNCDGRASACAHVSTSKRELAPICAVTITDTIPDASHRNLLLVSGLMIDNERLRLAHHRFSFDADEGEDYTPVVPC